MRGRGRGFSQSRGRGRGWGRGHVRGGGWRGGFHLNTVGNVRGNVRNKSITRAVPSQEGGPTTSYFTRCGNNSLRRVPSSAAQQMPQPATQVPQPATTLTPADAPAAPTPVAPVVPPTVVRTSHSLHRGLEYDNSRACVEEAAAVDKPVPAFPQASGPPSPNTGSNVPSFAPTGHRMKAPGKPVELSRVKTSEAHGLRSGEAVVPSMATPFAPASTKCESQSAQNLVVAEIGTKRSTSTRETSCVKLALAKRTRRSNVNLSFVRAPSQEDNMSMLPSGSAKNAFYVNGNGRSIRRVESGDVTLTGIQAQAPSRALVNARRGPPSFAFSNRSVGLPVSSRNLTLKKPGTKSDGKRGMGLNKRLDRRKLQHCLFFAKYGHCKAAESAEGCAFIHDPTAVGVCRSWLVGRCQDAAANCSLSHAVDKNKMPVCERFVDGRCPRSKDACPYLHVSHDANAQLCEAFALRGFCKNGAACSSVHTWNCLDYARRGECPRQDSCRLRHWTKQKRERAQSKVDLFSDSDSNSDSEDIEDVTRQEVEADVDGPGTRGCNGPGEDAAVAKKGMATSSNESDSKDVTSLHVHEDPRDGFIKL